MSRAAPVLNPGLITRFRITALKHLQQQNRIGWQHGHTPVFFQSWAPPLPKQDHARTSGAPAWTLIHFRSWLQALFLDVFVTMLWPFVRQSDSQSVEKVPFSTSARIFSPEMGEIGLWLLRIGRWAYVQDLPGLQSSYLLHQGPSCGKSPLF